MNMFAHLKSKPEMLSANDLLEIFPISRSGIYDLLREPGFPCIHLGRRIIVPRDAMIDWLENRLQEELNSAAKSLTKYLSCRRLSLKQTPTCRRRRSARTAFTSRFSPAT